MITNANIFEFIDNSIAERLERLGVTADRVIEQWAAIGFASMGDFLTADEYGCPTWDFENATRVQSAAIRDISIHTGGRGRRINIKLADKPAALMMLGKYLDRATAARRPEAPPSGTRYEIKRVEIIDPVEPQAYVRRSRTAAWKSAIRDHREPTSSSRLCAMRAGPMNIRTKAR